MQRPRLRDLLPVSVRTFDPEEVTTRSHREIDPRGVGLSTQDVDAIWSSVVTFYKSGLHPAIALCIRRRGEIILDRAIGHARGNSPDDPEGAPLVRATPDTLFNFFSGSKSVTAMLIHLLQEEEQLHVDEPVATFIPEFAKRRKHNITIRDVLTHRAGIPATPEEAINLDLLSKPEAIVRAFCELEPTHRPGSVQAYQAVTSGFILGEIMFSKHGCRFLTDEQGRLMRQQICRQSLSTEFIPSEGSSSAILAILHWGLLWTIL